MVPPSRLRILTGAPLAEAIQGVVPELEPDQFLLEPRARGTAPVLAWAAMEILRHDEHAVMISLHADHVIQPAETFRTLLRRVVELSVQDRRLYTIGAVPDRPETGFGYIRTGAVLHGEDDIRAVARFVEKPSRRRARDYLRRGYLWNTGIFVWPAALLIEELRQHTPELAGFLPLLERGRTEEFFDRAPQLSIDEGLLERSARVAVAPATFAWDDVGAWSAVLRTRAVDSEGNAAIGPTHLLDTRRCVAWAEQGAVVLFGVQDLIVVRTDNITLVTRADRAADLKELLGRLPSELVEGDT